MNNEIANDRSPRGYRNEFDVRSRGDGFHRGRLSSLTLTLFSDERRHR